MELGAPRHRAAAWQAQQLDGADSTLSFSQILQDIVRASSVRHAALVMQHVPGVVEENSLILDNFGDAWRKHWMVERYDSIDPCIHGATFQEPVQEWSDLPRDRIRLRRFLRDFQDFRLGNHAITFFHRGHHGDSSLMTFATDVTEKRWSVLRQEIMAAVTDIHPALHRYILRTRFGISGVIIVKLTPREKECLGWAAHGRTSKEIGDALGLTASTVNFFIDAAVQKLAASNRAHAAAKAVALGLISPPR